MIKRANQKKKKGFSLIELIIVLAVMAIIALIAIPNFTAVRENAKVKSDVQSCNALYRTVETLTVDESIGGEGSISIDGTAAKVTSGVTFDTKVFASKTALKTHLKGIVTSLPQQEGKAGYIITLSAGKVTGVKVATSEEVSKVIDSN